MRFALIAFFALVSALPIQDPFESASEQTSKPLKNGPTIKFDGSEYQFGTLEEGQVSLVDPLGKKSKIEFNLLSLEEQKKIMNYTGWGRVWADSTGEHKTIADLVQVIEGTVVLELGSGERVVVPISKLSKIDQVYATSREELPTGALPDKFTARVVGVYDGDTVTVLLNRRQYKIRLNGIDAPEIGQAFGKKSKSFLGDLVHSKYVSGIREDTDKYGRNVCVLSIENKRVDYKMLKAGLAWHYVKYSDDKTRSELEAVAKSEKVGLWSESGPVPPWEWRRWGAAERKAWLAKNEKTTTPTPRPPVTETQKSNSSTAPVELVHWLNLSGNKRHNKSCRWYENTKKGRLCKPDEGTSCAKCGG